MRERILKRHEPVRWCWYCPYGGHGSMLCLCLLQSVLCTFKSYEVANVWCEEITMLIEYYSYRGQMASVIWGLMCMCVVTLRDYFVAPKSLVSSLGNRLEVISSAAVCLNALLTVKIYLNVYLLCQNEMYDVTCSSNTEMVECSLRSFIRIEFIPSNPSLFWRVEKNLYKTVL